MNHPLRTLRSLFVVGLLAMGLTLGVQAQTTLFTFENDTEGWVAGENTASVALIQTKPIGGGQTTTAFEGTNMLDAIPVDPPPQSNDWRAIERPYETPLDLSETPLIKFALSAFGYGPDSERHEARFTLFSGSESVDSLYVGIKDAPPTFINAWQVLEFDASDFDGVGSITMMRIEFRNNDDGQNNTPAPGPWAGKFQLDLVTAEAATSTAVDDVPGLEGLTQLYPNPATGRATLDLSVTRAQAVRAAIYDVLGRSVLTAYDGLAQPGTVLSIPIETQRLTPGLYFVRIEAEAFTQTRQLVVVR